MVRFHATGNGAEHRIDRNSVLGPRNRCVVGHIARFSVSRASEVASEYVARHDTIQEKSFLMGLTRAIPSRFALFPGQRVDYGVKPKEQNGERVGRVRSNSTFGDKQNDPGLDDATRSGLRSQFPNARGPVRQILSRDDNPKSNDMQRVLGEPADQREANTEIFNPPDRQLRFGTRSAFPTAAAYPEPIRPRYQQGSLIPSVPRRIATNRGVNVPTIGAEGRLPEMRGLSKKDRKDLMDDYRRSMR